MKRVLACVVPAALLIVALPAGAAVVKTQARFALTGEARGLELALGDQGLTLGVAFSGVDSKPSAYGVASGQCGVLGDEPDPDDLPCNESTTSKSSYPGDNEAGEVCAGPAVPDPLGSILQIDLACGSSFSALKKGLPTTLNTGKVAEASLSMDVSGVIPAAQDLKEQLIDELQAILEVAPEPIKNAVNNLADALDVGQAVQIRLGPADSSIVAEGKKLTVSSFAAGAQIGLLGIPDLDKDGLPIPGTSLATEDGLLIIEIGPARAQASIDSLSAKATSSASAAIVTLKVRDITKVEPTYTEIPVGVDQSVTILEGTPAESTITVSHAVQESDATSARAAADAVSLHLLKGVQGGIKLNLARVAAAAHGSPPVLGERPPAAQPKPKHPLPVTGGVALTGLGIALLAGSAAVVAIRRRFH